VQRRRKSRAVERGLTSIRVEELDMKVGLKSRKTIGADGGEEPSRSVVASHHEMLTVIDGITS
jgi:hypothetical protein